MQKDHRQGSKESTKQIARAVRDGHAVEVRLGSGAPIRGWVCGADDYHWIIVDLEGNTHLIHKSVPAIQIDAHSSLAGHQEIEDRVAPFRTFLEREHLNHAEPSKDQ